MQEQHEHHKETPDSWVAWFRAWWMAGVEKRRRHAMAVWGVEAGAEDWEARPDNLYRAVGAAWSARR